MNVHFLEYRGILAAVKEWMQKKDITLTKQYSPYISQNIYTLLKAKKSKQLYEILKRNQEVPTGKVVWNQIFDLNDEEWEGIFSLPFKLTKNTKLQWFQFRINHKILATNSFLHKIRIKDSDKCSFCNIETETIEHILWECEAIQELLNDFDTFCFDKTHFHVTYTKKDFILGSHVRPENIKGLLSLQIKYFIYSTKCAGKNITLNGLISSIKYMYEINKQIAIKNNKKESFDEAWEVWTNLFM